MKNANSDYEPWETVIEIPVDREFVNCAEWFVSFKRKSQLLEKEINEYFNRAKNEYERNIAPLNKRDNEEQQNYLNLVNSHFEAH